MVLWLLVVVDGAIPRGAVRTSRNFVAQESKIGFSVSKSADSDHMAIWPQFPKKADGRARG